MKNFINIPKPKIVYSLILLGLMAFSCKTDVKELTIRVRNRMYPGFQEDHKVKMYEKFSLSDTELDAVAVEFIPDFTIDTLTHRATSRSNILRNPAVRMLIVRGEQIEEEAWAFPPGMMSHFSAKSFIGFELIDYKVGGKYIKQKAQSNQESK